MRSAMRFLLASGLLLAGCQKDGPTTVGGDVALGVGAGATQHITLPAGTALPLDLTTGSSGVIAGHCVLGSTVTEVELERTPTGSVAPTGFVWFQLHVDSPDAPAGHVMAEYDGELYEADCDLATFARGRHTGALDVTINGCSLLTPSPSSTGTTSVTLTAMLSFDGCNRP